MVKNPNFKQKYETYIFNIIRDRINEFFINNNGKKKVLEIPLLFNARMENLCAVNIGVESENNIEFLKERKDKYIKEKLFLDKQNKYNEKKHRLDYIIKNNSSLEDLKKQVEKVIKEIEKEL